MSQPRIFLVLAWCMSVGACLACGAELSRLPPLTPLEQRLLALENEVRELRAHDDHADSAKRSAPAAEVEVECAPSAHQDKEYPTVRVIGFFHLDSAWFHQDQLNIQTVDMDIQDGVDFRRARLGAAGEVADWVDYKMEFDFAASQGRFVDVYANFGELPLLGNLRVGRWRQPFGMIELTSIENLPFLERALPFALAPFRQTGIGFFDHSHDERMTWAASLIRYPTDKFGNNAGDNGGYGFVGRMTYLPYYECEGERLVHLGVGYYFANPSLDKVHFSSGPEIQLVDSEGGLLPTPQLNVPPFVDTGTIPTDVVSGINVEFAAAMGRLYIQSEARWVTIEQMGSPTQTVEGAYIETRFVCTGEKLPYDTTAGVFGRIEPRDPVHATCGGSGAWELAARLSYLNLNGNWLAIPPATPAPGRRLTDITLGVNWYMIRHAKLQFNYIHAVLDDPTLGKSDADIFALRMQLDF